MRTSFIAAGVLVIALVLWMASGLFKDSNTNSGTDGSSAQAQIAGNGSEKSNSDTNSAVDELMKVQVTRANLKPRSREIVLQGQLEPVRVLQIRAKTSSTVATLAVSKGERVQTNDVIATLALDGRDENLIEADAQVVSAVSEQKAAARLREQGLQSVVQAQRADAALASARAQRNRMRRDIENTKITAPFSGIVNGLAVELGTLVTAGDEVAQLVDDSSYKVSAQVSQQAVNELSVGQPIEVALITGQVLEGTLSFVATVADSQTRSFIVEAAVRRPSEPISAGVSASLKIPVETLESVFLTPSALSLGDRGELGVKVVDSDDTVQFVPIELLSTTIDGAWVSGVPNGSRIITLGQAFVAVGEIVDPIEVGGSDVVDTNSTAANSSGG